MEDKIKSLYDAFVNDGYEMEPLEEFRKNLEDGEKRRAAYDALVSDGYEMEPFDEFEANIGFGGTAAQQPPTGQVDGTVVDQAVDNMALLTGRMPQDAQDVAFGGHVQTDGRSLAERENPQMFQQPAVDPEPWKAEGLTKEQYEDIAWTRQLNKATPQGYAKNGDNRLVKTSIAMGGDGKPVQNGTNEDGTPNYDVTYDRQQRTYQTKESWDSDISRKPSKYGQMRAGWRRGARVGQLDLDGIYLGGYVAQTDPDAAAQAEKMSDQELIATHRRLSKQVNKNYQGGISGFAETPEGQQLGARLNAIEKELHFRDLGYEHTSSVPGRGDVDYRTWMTLPDVAQEAQRLSGAGDRDAEVAALYRQGMTDGNMEAAERAMLASAALYCKELNIDMDTAYAKVEGDAFNAAMRAPLQADVDKIYNEEETKQRVKGGEAAYENTFLGLGADPTRSAVDAFVYDINSRKAAPTKEMLNTMARRAINESAAARAYYGLMLREHMRGGTMDIIHARAAAMNDVRNLFRDIEVAKATPNSSFGLIVKAGASENLPVQALRGLTNLITGDYESDMIFDEGMAKAKANAGVMTNVLAGTAPFVADAALGSFKIPGMVGKAVSMGTGKLFTWTLNRMFGLGEEVAAKRLGGSWVYRIVAGGLSSSANFGTYMGMSTAVQGARRGEFSLGATWEGTNHGMWDGLIFGGWNGSMSKIIEKAKGGWAIAAEAGSLATEAGVFTALDYMRTGEITAEGVGQSVGMVLASRAMNFKGWASDVLSRVDGSKWKRTVQGPTKWSKQTRDELRDRYPTLCRLMGDDNLAVMMTRGATGKANHKTGNLKEVDAAQTANAIEHEFEAMKNDESVPFAAYRMANYVLNGEVMPKPVTCNWRVTEPGEDGVSYGETIDINGHVIERFELKSDDERRRFEAGVAVDAERNRLAIEQAAWRAREVEPVIADAIDAVAGSHGIDRDELARAYFTEDRKIKGKAMRAAVREAEALVNAELRTKTDHQAAVENKYGVDLEEVVKTPAKDRTETEQQALDEYELRLTDRYNENQDKSTAELIQDEKQQSHDDGYKAEGEQLAEVKERLEDAANTLAEMRIDPRQFDGMTEQEVSDWLESRGNNEEEIDAVLDYLNAKAAFDGVRDKVNDTATDRIEQVNKETDGRTNKVSGKIHRVMVRPDNEDDPGREAFVIDGKITINEDGTVDRENSDKDIIVSFGDGSKPEMRHIDDVLSGDQPIDPEQLKQEAADGIVTEETGKAVSQMNRDLAFNQGDVYDVMIEGQPMTARVLDADPQQPDNVLVEFSNGQRGSVPKAALQGMADEWREAQRMPQQPVEGKAPEEEQPAQSAGPRDNAAPVEERPAEEQAAGPAIMPAPGAGDPQEMLDYFRASGASDRAIDKTITNNIIAAAERLEKAQRDAEENKDVDLQKQIELDNAVETAQRELDYWNEVGRRRWGHEPGETAAEQRPTEQAGAPVAENEMQPMEEPTQDAAAADNTVEREPGMSAEDKAYWRQRDPQAAEVVDRVAREMGLPVVTVDWDPYVNGCIHNGVIYINANSPELLGFVMGHEMTHDMQRRDAIDGKDGDAYTTFKELAIQYARENYRPRVVSDGADAERVLRTFDEYVEWKKERYREGVGQELTDAQVLDEIAADVAGRILQDPEKAMALLEREAADVAEGNGDLSRFQRLKEAILEWIRRLKSRFAPDGEQPDEEQYTRLEEVEKALQNLYETTVKNTPVLKGDGRTVTDMTDVAAADVEREGTQYSYGTENMVSEKLRRWATSGDGAKLGWTPEKIDSVIQETDVLIDAIDKALQGDKNYDEWRLRQPTMRIDWRYGEERPVVTWTRGNIEYKYDMSADLLCVNNEGMEEVLSSPVMAELLLKTMLETKIADKDKGVFSREDYGRLYEVMRDQGFTVPCPGCFDYAARLKMLPSVAQNFAKEVNAVIDERNKDRRAFDKALKEEAKKDGNALGNGLPATAKSRSQAIRIAVAGDNITKHINWHDLLTADGQTGMLAEYGGLFRAWQRTGAGRPKDKLLPEPWIGEIVDTGIGTIIAPYGGKTPSFREKEVNVGTGLRRNSHSEFRVTLIIDEIQMLREAFAKNLTVFKYMKELDDVRLFGQLGVKYNMSFFPGFDKNGTAAGLDANGDYIAAEESVGAREFPYQGEDGRTHYDGMKGREEAMKYCNENVSLSSVAFSVPHFIKLLTDVPTPSDKRGWVGSIIPFHSSGATTKDLAVQGLGLARANSADAEKGHAFADEAYSDWDKGVTNFEQVQNDRFGEGWVILEGKKKGQDVPYGHKMEFANGTHYYNQRLGVHLFPKGYVYDSELPDGRITKQIKDNPTHPFVVDYNDKVREIGSDYGYKEASDYYVQALREIGMIPRFEFEVPEQVFLEACAAAHVDPHHPKLGWKGEGNNWSPTDAESYYSVWCDYGMTDPKTGKWSPHRPVGYINANGEREFRLPDNTIEIAKEGLSRYSGRRAQESGMVNDAIREYVRRSVEAGRMDGKKARRVLKKYGVGEERDGVAQYPDGWEGQRYSLVEDPLEVARLESEPKLEGYRNVSLKEDGTFRSPMADKLSSKGKEKRPTEPFRLNRWEKADENPDLATDDGKIDLGKPGGLGTVGGVDYNPYIHIRPTLVNKQFKNAWERDDLVYVRTLYPESELSSGYQADKAKKAVGRHDWNGGELILSRWDKPVEIVPWERVADDWVAEFKGRGVEFDIVPPKLLPILAERGIEILPPHKGMGKACRAAYEAWKKGENPDGPGDGKSVDSIVAEAEQMTETNPTDGQKESGNYKKGHVKVDGFDISIEQPKGSVRSGVDADGKAWSQEMHNTYGYIRGTEGVDGDHIDVFLSDHLDGWNGNVYVVDQVNKDRSFDEHKVMYGFNSEQEAREAYLSNHEEGWTGLGNITGVSREEFKKWVDSSHRKNKPFAEYKNVKPLQSTGTVDRARFSISERTDEAGNEVYTETREDGTKDREVVTMPDGSRDVTWFDEAGRKKEVLSYYPNGEVRQVNNYDSDGELTRQIQYDENRRAIRHWEPRIGTDWERDDNGVARGMSNGVYITPYGSRFSISDEERDAQTHSANFKRWFGDWENDPENASKVVDAEGKPLVVWHGGQFGQPIEDYDTYTWDADGAGGWFSASKEYSNNYRGLQPTEDGRGYNYLDPIQVYLNIRNPFELGDNNGYIIEDGKPTQLLTEVAKRLGVDEKTITDMIDWDFADSDKDAPLYTINRTKAFADLLKEKGYDGAHAIEFGNDTYMITDPHQIKSATENNGEFDPNNPDIRFSLSEDSQKIFDTAKRKFGETKDIREAGYVLPDGAMLDFSGRHELDPGTDSSFLAGRRATDHRAINQISFVYDENGDEVDTGVSSDMPDFIKRGAIRIDNNAGLINLSAAPTMAQRRVLRELIRRNGGDVQVDFGDGWDSDHYVEYEEASAQRVLGDIDRYFDEGIKPEGNVRFSIGDGDMDGWQSEQVSWERAALYHLLQNAANNEGNRSIRSQAVQAVNSTLADLLRRISQSTDRGAYNSVEATNVFTGAVDNAMNAQRRYDRWTVDELVSMAKSMLKSGMYDGLSPYEVNRLIGKINQGASRDEIQAQMNTVFDVLMNANLRSWDKHLRKLTSIRDVRMDNHGVRVMGQVDKMGSVMLRSMRNGMDLSQEDLEQKIAEVSDRLSSDNSIDADNAAVELEGLMLAQQYNDLVGKYDADNKAIKGQVREQLEQIYDFWREPNRDEEGNIIYRKDGLMSTTEKRRLKPEFGGLDEDGNSVIPTEEAKAARKRVEATVAALEGARRENQVRMSEGYARLTDALGGGVAAAVTRAKEFREGEKRRKQEIYHAANSDLLDVSNTTQDMDPSDRSSAANNGILRFFLNPLSTFDKMIRYFGRRSANGEGRLFNRFMRGQAECSHNEWNSFKAGLDEMDAKSDELFGMRWMKLGNAMRDGKKFPPIQVSYWDNNNYVTSELRQDEAAYLYCVNKMRDGRMKLEAMGIDEDMIQQIAQQIDPRLIQLADWYQGEFLPSRRDYYNQVYERMFGTPMARIENYIHLNINQKSIAQNKELSDRMAGENSPSTITGSLKERKTNVTPIRLHTSLLDLAMQEHQKMEHWAAWGEYNRDLKDLINYGNFRAKVSNLSSKEFGSGIDLLRSFEKCAAIVTGDYQPAGRKSGIDTYAANWAKFVATAKIAFRPFTALKQALSFPAFMSDARPDDLLKATLNPKGSVEWAMKNLPGFAKRWQSRQAGDTRLMETDSDWNIWRNSTVQKMGRAGLWMNAGVDCLTVAVGSRGVYETAKRRYLSYGYTDAQAEKKALEDASIAYNASQQSSEGAFTSAQQTDRTIMSIATTCFRNASMGYERRFTTAVRNLKRMAQKGYRDEVIENTAKQMMEEGLTEEQVRRAAERVYNRSKWHSMMDIVNYGFALPFFWNLGPALIYIVGGNDNEQKMELLRDSALHAMFGPIEGLTFGGTMSEMANIFTGSMLMDGKTMKETMQGLRGRNFTPLPILSDAQNLYGTFSTDMWSGLNDLANLLVQAGTGVNPETFTDVAVAILDACNGDLDVAKETGFFMMRLANMPKSQVDKIYMDELGLSSEEGAKMSWEELAQRYAKYNARKDAPLAAALLPDDMEEAREERYVKRFWDRVKERLESASDEDLERVYGQGDEQRRMVAKETAKRAGLESDRYGKKPGADAKPETVKAIETYQRRRSYADMAEDVLLQKAKKDAADAGDDERADAIEKALKAITKLRGGMGRGDRYADDKALEKIREVRGKALKDFDVTK